MNVRIKSLFDFLNSHCIYVVLRNWDNLIEDSIYNEGHEDIDILCFSLKQFIFTTGAKRIHKERSRDNYLLTWDGVRVRFDVRWVGDGYYPEIMERAMLEHRVLNNQGIFVPNQEDYYHSLLYHALVQKPHLSDEYKEKLNMIYYTLHGNGSSFSKLDFVQQLKCFLVEHGLKVVYPRDPGVFINTAVISCVPTEIDYFRFINRKILLAKQMGQYYLKHVLTKLKLMNNAQG